MTFEEKAAITVTGRSIDVTPILNYSREITIVKRFIERLTALSEAIAEHDPSDTETTSMELSADMADFVRPALPFVRQAVSELMADDIKAQIMDGRFPLRVPVITFHEFEPEDQIDGATSRPRCINEDCYAFEDTAAHALA